MCNCNLIQGRGSHSATPSAIFRISLVNYQPSRPGRDVRPETERHQGQKEWNRALRHDRAHRGAASVHHPDPHPENQHGPLIIACQRFNGCGVKGSDITDARPWKCRVFSFYFSHLGAARSVAFQPFPPFSISFLFPHSMPFIGVLYFHLLCPVSSLTIGEILMDSRLKLPISL